MLLAATVSTSEGQAEKAAPVRNPHGDPARCTSCHTSAAGGRQELHFDRNVMLLCQSCHDGRRAGREVHPVGVSPSAAFAGKIPSDLPLESGKLTCLTCHDIPCGPPNTASNRNFLRAWQGSDLVAFCFQCHVREAYRPFNVHDQLETGGMKVEVCAWCHAGVPDANASLDEPASSPLRGRGSGVCVNCHPTSEGHPVIGTPSTTPRVGQSPSHLGAIPSVEFLWHMSAYELQPKMRLPFEQLVQHVSAAKRAPRSIPLDERGRIACYTCHNPHEEGLLPSSNPRAVGAEPEQAVHHRVRAREGKLCTVCHEK